MRAKSSALTRKTRISQNASPESRVWKFVSCGVYQPMKTPIVTAASTPDTPASCAGRNARYPERSASATSVGVSSVRRRTSRTTKPTASPIAIPPKMSTTRCQVACQSENEPATAAATAVL